MQKRVDDVYYNFYNMVRRQIMERKIYNELLNWKENNIEMPLMVIRCKTGW